MPSIAEHMKRREAIREAHDKRQKPPALNDPDFWANMALVRNGGQINEPKVKPLWPMAKETIQ